MLILDEADEMLNQGFNEQIYDIYRYLPPATQVVLLSATLPHEILEMTKKFMTDPVRILVKRCVLGGRRVEEKRDSSVKGQQGHLPVLTYSTPIVLSCAVTS